MSERTHLFRLSNTKTLLIFQESRVIRDQLGVMSEGTHLFRLSNTQALKHC
jgi:hypothetical protein